jgi:hypothetical protein
MKELEASISKNIHLFDIASLLQLLRHMGYHPEEIQFRSHDGITSQPGLIHDISFKKDPARHVVIRMNLGLVSAQSPLPSYMRRKMDAEIGDIQSVIDFFGFFDHILILNYLTGIYPEMNKALYPDWESRRRRYLLMLDLRSCSTLHWLFQLVFPELGLHVEKTLLERTMSTTPIVLGRTVLGNDAMFGKITSIPVSGRRVTLYSEGEFTNREEPWPREVKKRLEEQIFPILQAVGIDIEIFLVIQSQRSWVKLHSESYLGYDRIQGARKQCRRIGIFRGCLSQQIAEKGAGVRHGM